MSETTSTAPAQGRDFKHSPAEHDLLEAWDPLGDELATAYAAAAAVLNDGQWHQWFALHDHMAAARPDASEADLRNYFRKAVRQGWITRGYQNGPERYRVTKCGLIERPELRGREGQFSTPSAWRDLREQVDWLDDPKLGRPAPVPEQPRPEPKAEKPKAAARKAEASAVPTVATIVAVEGQLHPTQNCQCGQRLVFRNGKVPPKGDRWQCPLYRGNPGWADPNHDRVWAS